MADSLFAYAANNELGLSEIESMLLQMMTITEEKHFKPEQLSACSLADDYLNSDGKHTLTNG